MSCASFAPAATGAPYGCWRNLYAHSERDDIRDVQIRVFTHLNTRHCCKDQPAPVAHAASRKVAAQCAAARIESWELHDEMVRGDEQSRDKNLLAARKRGINKPRRRAYLRAALDKLSGCQNRKVITFTGAVVPRCACTAATRARS